MTKRITTTTRGTVESIDHAATSRNGNPTYRVTLTDGRSFLTETDGSVGYAATNYRPDRRHPDAGVALTLGLRSRVVSIERVDGTES